MTGELLPFGPGALTFIAGYVSFMLVIGWLGYRARKANTLADFFLAGRGFGFVVLVFTLYATQYSGNTLMGFTGSTYRLGFSWVMSVHFMTAIVVFYLAYAPKLYQRARSRGYLTPSDYLYDRYGSRPLAALASLMMIVAAGNFLMAQLMAMGRALEGLSGHDPRTAYIFGVAALALIMAIYESIGGLRAVAWTDVLQGAVLFSGFIILIALVTQQYGTLGDATRAVLDAVDEETRAKALPPGPGRSAEWLSYIILVGLGGALYPQAVQRIYAAESAGALRRSLMVMAFMPFTTALVAVVVGIIALANIPGLAGPSTDRILMIICREVQDASLLGYWLVVVLFSALLAALMSTADSALLSISSMFTKDFYKPFIRPSASEAELTKAGKITSWLVLSGLVALAIALREHATLIQLLDRKFDLLIQLAPAFILGMHWRGLRADWALAGVVAGVVAALGLAALGHARLYHLHPGVWGLGLNLAIATGGSLALARLERNRALARTRGQSRQAAGG